MERVVNGVIIPDLRDAISRARRSPSHCLYCAEPATSWEHALPEALGGRLEAPILCPNHNRLVGAKADAPMIRQFSPLVHMLDIKRHRGERGATLRGRSDAGEALAVERNGRVRRRKLEAKAVAASGRLKYARGALAKLDELLAAGALEPGNHRIIAYAEKPPIINYEIDIGADAERGVLKAALHFVASFAADVDLGIAAELFPYVLGEEVSGGKFVRTVPLEERFFPESWPPRHEIRTYPGDAGETFATVLLFGIYGFQVRLPISTGIPLRYVQPLIDSTAPVLEANTVPRNFTWDDHMTAHDWEAAKSNMNFRHAKLEGFAKCRLTREQCKGAAQRASNSMYTLRMDFLDAYRAELQQEAFSSEEISVLLAFARSAIPARIPVWDLPLEQFAGFH